MFSIDGIRKCWDHLRVCGADLKMHRPEAAVWGSSPRVRSGRSRVRRSRVRARIISACAERTNTGKAPKPRDRDHLRVCGADCGCDRGAAALLGSSPRVRSGLAHLHQVAKVAGIISACAERTDAVRVEPVRDGDYLRVCGADELARRAQRVPGGLSPRVRSGPPEKPRHRRNRGIISACAERTPPSHGMPGRSADYLRVCGADMKRHLIKDFVAGLSPRVRSGPVSPRDVVPRNGIISACAERTSATTGTRCTKWDYLRVCGADVCTSRLSRPLMGLSPRVRSGLEDRPDSTAVSGIISACAERTSRRARRSWRLVDYLRVCGADLVDLSGQRLQLGLSPRVRSGLRYEDAGVAVGGIISAGAERTVVFYCGLRRSGDMEYLIRALRGVGKRRGYQYLE